MRRQLEHIYEELVPPYNNTSMEWKNSDEGKSFRKKIDLLITAMDSLLTITGGWKSDVVDS